MQDESNLACSKRTAGLHAVTVGTDSLTSDALSVLTFANFFVLLVFGRREHRDHRHLACRDHCDVQGARTGHLNDHGTTSDQPPASLHHGKKEKVGDILVYELGAQAL